MNKQKGFSLIEFLIVIAVIVILATIGVVQYRDFQKQTALESASQNVLDTLKAAQTQTLASRDLSSYGLHFETASYVLFKGTTYNVSDPDNQVHQLPAGIEIYELTVSDIFFEKITGLPNPADASAIRLRIISDPSRTKSIRVEPSGVIALEGTLVCCQTHRLSDNRHLHFQLSWSIQNSATTTLNFTDSPAVVTKIKMADYFDGLKTEFSWSGTINVNGQNQQLQIHTHQLDAFNTLLCVHRDQTRNNKPLQIMIDDGYFNDKSIVSYTADGVASVGAFGGVMTAQ